MLQLFRSLVEQSFITVQIALDVGVPRQSVFVAVQLLECERCWFMLLMSSAVLVLPRTFCWVGLAVPLTPPDAKSAAAPAGDIEGLSKSKIIKF